MYEAFYGFSGRPFQLNPDPAFLFGSRGHNGAFSYLKYGVHQGEGFIILTGEIGAGKTTLVRALLHEVDRQQVVAAQIVSTQLNGDELLGAAAAAFGLPLKAASKSELIATLEAFFTTLASRGQRALLVVDEAQNLSPRALEELRLLSNFQLTDQPLLQSFLVGQPELRDMLGAPDMEQLRQRVIASYHLGPMNAIETQAYIEHRLRHVGWSGNPQIAADAFAAIFDWTQGLPRKINLLCNRLLLASYLAEQYKIDVALVNNVVGELRTEIGGGEANKSPRVKADVLPLDINRAASNREPPSQPMRIRDRMAAIEASLNETSELFESPSMDDRAPPSLAPAPYVTSATSSAPADTTPPLAELGFDPGGPLLCVVGTRPDFMKVASVIKAISARAAMPPVLLVYTGQLSEYALSAQLFADLDLPSPHVNLDVGTHSSIGETAEVMTRFDPVIQRHYPSMVMVVGDSPTALACALTAAQRGVPVVHLEAGLRHFDRSDAAEVNRVLIDQIASLLYVTERGAQQHLAREGISASRVQFVGNTMIDALFRARRHAVVPEETLRCGGASTDAIADTNGYAIVTLHHTRHLTTRAGLANVVTLLRSASQLLPLVWVMHPKIRGLLNEFELAPLLSNARITCLSPQGYFEMVGLLRGATAILTDSSGVQDEATALGVPCLTLATRTERAASVECGGNTLVGLDTNQLTQALSALMVLQRDRNPRQADSKRLPDLWDGHAGERIAQHLTDWYERHRSPHFTESEKRA